MIVYGYSLIKCKLPKNKVYLIKRMSATAAASNTPGASSSATTSSATTSSISSNPVEHHRYARTLQPRTELIAPLTTINVYVYKKDEDILEQMTHSLVPFSVLPSAVNQYRTFSIQCLVSLVLFRVLVLVPETSLYT